MGLILLDLTFFQIHHLFLSVLAKKKVPIIRQTTVNAMIAVNHNIGAVYDKVHRRPH